mgnify:CR=1 FL=1
MTRGLKGTSPKATCCTCKKTFATRPYKIKSGVPLYCCWECKIEGLKRLKTEPCHYCGKDVTRRKSQFRRGGAKLVFCNKSCSTNWRVRNPTAVKMTKYNKIGKALKAERYGSACVICGFSRFVEYCHIIPSSKNGTIHPDNIIPLCPTHHTLMDKFLLNQEEETILKELRLRASSSLFSIKPQIT